MSIKIREQGYARLVRAVVFLALSLLSGGITAVAVLWALVIHPLLVVALAGPFMFGGLLGWALGRSEQ